MIEVEGRAYSPDEVREIRCHMLNNKVHIVGGLLEPGEISQPSASFTIQSTVCNAILHGCVFPEFETPEALGGEDFQSMIKKYVQIADIDDSKSDDWAYIEIELTDGAVLSAHYGKIRPGMMTGPEPLPMEYIKDKFMRNAKFGGVVSARDAEAVWEMCMNFEQLDSIDKLVSLLVPKA